MKTIRKQVIIRECEYGALCAKFARNKLFDRAEYIPLTYKGIQQENMVAILKGEFDQRFASRFETLPDLYHAMLSREKHLYNRKYIEWDLTMDFPDGQIWVQSRSNVVKDRLVTATFEKDLM